MESAAGPQIQSANEMTQNTTKKLQTIIADTTTAEVVWYYIPHPTLLQYASCNSRLQITCNIKNKLFK